ncbi:MAG: histidine triad nucleotide-binding protein [Candidatus Taylorbacteria bacterium RIFOXYD2_FULL_36_9]|uniref:Histidine triad nucleotide-binding protein n=1 Tax=Candidatus Taylorbacteria bacterium RIFOXYD2_FULL_36_9 TaxID=1802338 RepID=A0A1G2PGW7_9BACT|nr:MAG: histidine triad nucleotide-binding protein [Candidatus Taylorbacteria bacterium RIFOXYD2_FULL_36_9]
MKNANCLFCKIVAKEIPAEILFENKKLIILQDIKPSAPFHHLIIPKEHIQSVAHLEEKDRAIIADLFFAARDDAQKAGLKGYKTIFNIGREGGQIIDHLHLHLMGGWKN